MGWDFGPYGSFQGCVVPHINGTYLCFPHELSILTFLFLFLLPFTFLRLKPANISSLNHYLAFFIKKGELDFKGLGASLARSGLEPSFPLNFRTLQFWWPTTSKIPYVILLRLLCFCATTSVQQLLCFDEICALLCSRAYSTIVIRWFHDDGALNEKATSDDI